MPITHNYVSTAPAVAGKVDSTEWNKDHVITVNTGAGTINRDGNGYITSVEKPSGVTITLTRNASNLITSATDGTNTWTFTRVADIITSWSVT